MKFATSLMDYIWPQSVQQNNGAYDFISPLPQDLWRRIFSIVKANLHEMAQVSKKWKEMAYDRELYKMILPPQRFDQQAWEKYFGIVEEETLLPLCFFKDYEMGEKCKKYQGYLTWIPETVQVVQKDGTFKKVILDSALKLEDLVQNPKDGNKAGYHPTSWRKAIDEPRTQEMAHWVWIYKTPLYNFAAYETQEKGVMKQGKLFTNGGHVASFINALTTHMVQQVCSQKTLKQKSEKKHKFIRVKEKTENLRLLICISHEPFTISGLDDNIKDFNTAILIERKSYGRGFIVV